MSKEWALVPKDRPGVDGNFTGYLAGITLNGSEMLVGDEAFAPEVHREPAPHAYPQSQTSHLRKKEVIKEVAVPRVFFLFMSIAGVDRVDQWQAFFEGVPWSQYRLFLHCKRREICDLRLTIKNPLGFTLVDTVPSEYCHDLVSPMVQLTKHAMIESASLNDKFLFLSESTLPVKPFWHVYSELVKSRESDICVGPVESWLGMRLNKVSNPLETEHAILVKHSQWVVLSQEHARAMVLNWDHVKQAGARHQDQWAIPVWRPGAAQSNGTGQAPHVGLGKMDKSVRVCTDEWAIFASLYGAIIDVGQSQVSVPGFSTNVLQLHPAGPNFVQGVCRTFVFWGVDREDAAGLVNELLSDGGTHMSCYPRCMGSHPADFLTISDYGASALRRSPFLFARKFTAGAMSVDQFRRIILT